MKSSIPPSPCRKPDRPTSEGSYFNVIRGSVEKRIRATDQPTLDQYCSLLPSSEELDAFSRRCPFTPRHGFVKARILTIVESASETAQILTPGISKSWWRLAQLAKRSLFCIHVRIATTHPPSWQYSLVGFDIDRSVSLRAKRDYAAEDLLQIPDRYKSHLEKRQDGGCHVSRAIQDNCQFFTGNLLDLSRYELQAYDW